jgi:hypothetical protein
VRRGGLQPQLRRTGPRLGRNTANLCAQQNGAEAVT